MAGMIISTYTMFLPQQTALFCCIALAVIIFGIWIPYEEHKKKKKQQAKKESPRPVRIKPARKDADKRVEQLDVLKEAGLLTEEEYRERKRSLK